MLIKIGNYFVDPTEIAAVGGEFADIDGIHYINIWLRKNEQSVLVESTMDEAEAALIDADVIEDPADDPMALIVEEMELLEQLDDEGYHFLARDRDGKLFAYRHMPTYDGAYWNPETPVNDEVKALNRDACPFVTVDDAAPFDIREVLP